ncbi:MAG: cell division protein ZapB [Nitrospiraceae bacterium]
MALDKLEALESRVKDLVKALHDLRQKNQLLEQDLRAARARLFAQEEANRRWERERAGIKTRVEKVLGEVELLECWEDSKEVALG